MAKKTADVYDNDLEGMTTELERLFYRAQLQGKTLSQEEVSAMLKAANIQHFQMSSVELTDRWRKLFYALSIPVVAAGCGYLAYTLLGWEGNFYDLYLALTKTSLAEAYNVSTDFLNPIKNPGLLAGLLLATGMWFKENTMKRLGWTLAIIAPFWMGTPMMKDGMEKPLMPIALSILPADVAKERAVVVQAEIDLASKTRTTDEFKKEVAKEGDRKGFGPRATAMQGKLDVYEQARAVSEKTLAVAKDELQKATEERSLAAKRLAIGVAAVGFALYMASLKIMFGFVVGLAPLIVYRLSNQVRDRAVQRNELLSMVTSHQGVSAVADRLLRKAEVAADLAQKRLSAGEGGRSIFTSHLYDRSAVIDSAAKGFLEWAWQKNQEGKVVAAEPVSSFLIRTGMARAPFSLRKPSVPNFSVRLPSVPVPANDDARTPVAARPAVNEASGVVAGGGGPKASVG
ncbi:MAG: hypothetical protein EBZ69_02315 [Alphaproteobacteria bacterium]|nr:hypothetical protein [Alphaproteobacteria bacterium]